VNIEEIEGIGPTYRTKLEAAGVKTVEALLDRAGPAAARAALAEEADISEHLLLEWANHADLMRINGVGSEYADLLEEAGVDSCPELARRNAANLAKAMDEINEAKKLVRRVPNEGVVQGWIDQAAKLPKAVFH
jgi:predicted flap endonuclease-1-like 5' DNA nuclease